DTIEQGHDSSDDRDSSVATQRAKLDQRLLAGEANAQSTPESLKYSATRPESTRERLTPDQQVSAAATLLVERLSAAAEMTSTGVEEMSAFMGTPVSLLVETDGEARAVSPEKAREVAIKLREIKGQLVQWLHSTIPPQEG